MITKWYEVTCDYCGRVINHYSKKPSNELLDSDGAVTIGTKQFCCEACKGDYKHELDEKRYLNINPRGNIHREKGGKE